MAIQISTRYRKNWEDELVEAYYMWIIEYKWVLPVGMQEEGVRGHREHYIVWVLSSDTELEGVPPLPTQLLLHSRDTALPYVRLWRQGMHLHQVDRSGEG
jgi:hypothetical protein